MEHGVRGPMTATMATLHDLCIIPPSPWKWSPAENPDVDWTYTGGDPDPFLSEMQQRLSHRVWEQAACALPWSRCGKWCGQRKSMMVQGFVSTNPDAHVACVLCAVHL